MVGRVVFRWRLMDSSPLLLAAAHLKFSEFESMIVHCNGIKIQQQFLESSTHPLKLASYTENNYHTPITLRRRGKEIEKRIGVHDDHRCQTAPPSIMAPSTIQHRRTHNILLISKLLNQRDASSPFTLILDNLDQSGQPLLAEYTQRANV